MTSSMPDSIYALQSTDSKFIAVAFIFPAKKRLSEQLELFAWRIETSIDTIISPYVVAWVW